MFVFLPRGKVEFVLVEVGHMTGTLTHVSL